MASIGCSDEPFAEGRFRCAYLAQYLDLPDRCGDLAVVKKYKETYLWKQRDLSICVDIYKEAQAMATGFNKYLQNDLRVNFTDVRVIEVTSVRNQDSTFRIKEYGVVEDYIPGIFTKWCNNYGYISAEAKQNATSMPAFMHWSWVNSSGEKMISDLQGVRKDNPPSYTLTDPAILSISGQYGVTDTGVEGMAMFFLRHQCNDICNGLPKPELKEINSAIPETQLLQDIGNATTYTHELKFSPRVKESVTTIFRRVCGGCTLI